jgi:hypothetical protein
VWVFRVQVMTEERTKQAYCALLGSLSFSPRSLSRLVQAGKDRPCTLHSKL